MLQNLTENEIKCKSHGEKIILFSLDECENFKSRLYCLSCFNNKLPPRQLINFQKIVEQMNQYNHEQIQIKSFNILKQKIIQIQEQFYKQFLLLKEKLDNQINQVQLKYQDWVDKIQNIESPSSNAQTFLEQLEEFSKVQNSYSDNQTFKKEILEINMSEYHQMYKLLDGFNFYVYSDELKNMLQNVFEMFNTEQVIGKIELKPIKYYQIQNPFINLICKEHNSQIQNIALEEDSEHQKQRLKCSQCIVGKAVSVEKFFEFFSQQQEEVDRAIKNKKNSFIGQMNKVKHYFLEVRNSYLEQLKQLLEELDCIIIKEINCETSIAQKQVDDLKKEDIEQMIDQILCRGNSKIFKEEKDLQEKYSVINSMIIKKSIVINHIITVQETKLFPLIQQTSDELEQQNQRNLEMQNRITEFFTQTQEQKEAQKAVEVKQSIMEIKEELISSQVSLFEQLSQKLTKVENKEQDSKQSFDELSQAVETIQKKFSNQDQRIEKIKNVLESLASSHDHLSNKLIDYSQVYDNFTQFCPYGMTFNYQGDLLIYSFQKQIQIRGFKNQVLTATQQVLRAQHYPICVIVSSKKFNWFFAGAGQCLSSYKEINGQWYELIKKNIHNKINLQLAVKINQLKFGKLITIQTQQLWNNLQNRNTKIKLIAFHGITMRIRLFLQVMINQLLFGQKQIIENGLLNNILTIRVQFINDLEFALTLKEKAIIQVFNYVQGQYTELNQLRLTYDSDYDDDDMFFNSIYLQPQQILISKHNQYVYFLKKCNANGLKITNKPIDSLSNQTYGALTYDGKYLALQNGQNGQFRVYKLDDMNINGI